MVVELAIPLPVASASFAHVVFLTEPALIWFLHGLAASFTASHLPWLPPSMLAEHDVVVLDLLLCSVVFMVEANGRRMRMNGRRMRMNGWQWQ
jgi:hypothetical protein